MSELAEVPPPMKASLTSTLSVRNGKQALAFYKAALDARELLLVESPDGDVVAQLAIGESAFWIADESPAHQNFSPETLGGSTVRLALTVNNPDEVFEKALQAGATQIFPVEDQSYGWRLGRLVDPFGHHWEIGKPLE